MLKHFFQFKIKTLAKLQSQKTIKFVRKSLNLNVHFLRKYSIYKIHCIIYLKTYKLTGNWLYNTSSDLLFSIRMILREEKVFSCKIFTCPNDLIQISAFTLQFNYISINFVENLSHTIKSKFILLGKIGLQPNRRNHFPLLPVPVPFFFCLKPFCGNISRVFRGCNVYWLFL